MSLNFLDFEQPIAELEAKIDSLTAVSRQDEKLDINIDEEVHRLREKSVELTRKIFADLGAWQIAQLARHPQRPYTLDYVRLAFGVEFYSNKVDNQAEVVSMGQVPCANIALLSDFDKPLLTDPVKFESTWMSKTGKYLNLSLQLKTGVTDDSTAAQSLAIISDTLVKHADSKQIRHLILYHDQGNVPEYYSTKVYLSIPTNRIDADSVRISINSYDGEVIAKHRIR